MKHVKGKFVAAIGVAAGYVLGSRAGRERYEKIKSKVTGAWKDPRVQDKVHAAEDVAKEKVQSAAETVKETVKDKTSGSKDEGDIDPLTGRDTTPPPASVTY